MNRDELCHQWAAQSRPHRKAGNISYDGPTLYSYSAAIARIHTLKAQRGEYAPGAHFVLMCQEQYSKTTAAHKSAARSAVSHMPLVQVPHILPLSARDHGDNLDSILADMAELLKAAQRAQMPYNVEYRCNNARALRDLAAAYVVFFKVRRQVPAFPQLAWTNAMRRAERIANPDPASADKRERARAARIAAKAIRERKAQELAAVHDMARRSDWRLHGAFGAGGYGRFQPIMLRLDVTETPTGWKEEIETSMGARIPAAAAPMVWGFIERIRARGEAWSRQGLAATLRIGDYPLDRIDADGTLHAGCHTIPYSELRMMARTLGLAS